MELKLKLLQFFSHTENLVYVFGCTQGPIGLLNVFIPHFLSSNPLNNKRNKFTKRPGMFADVSQDRPCSHYMNSNTVVMNDGACYKNTTYPSSPGDGS